MYEAMIILRPGLSEEEQKTVVGQLEGILQQDKAELKNSQVFAKRQLAYAINNYKEGLYYLINFSTEQGSVVAKLKKAASINENVLRTLVIKRRGK